MYVYGWMQNKDESYWYVFILFNLETYSSTQTLIHISEIIAFLAECED